MTLRVKIKINPKLYRAFSDGANVAANKLLAEMRTDLAKFTPDVYQDYGAELSNMLKRAGIEPVAGALAEAWQATVNDVQVLRFNQSNKCYMKLFDSRNLQAHTPWIGTTIKPRTRKRSTEPRLNVGYGVHQDIKIGNLGAAIQDDGAYRPLPAANKVSVGKKVSSFVWAPNPYQGYGYWLLYEQGYHSGGIAYDGRFFIRDAYSSVLGIDANRMFTGTDNTLRLNQRIINKFKSYMTTEIKAELK